MATVSRDKLKQKGLRRLVKSFKYAFEGLAYAFKYEQNITVHTVAMCLAVIAGVYFNISGTEWLILFLVIGLVIATELINTSIEAVVDLITDQHHPIAKVAKDTAASAVLVFGFTALAVGIGIFLPKIITYLNLIMK